MHFVDNIFKRDSVHFFQKWKSFNYFYRIIFVYTVIWFQVFKSNTNNSINHKTFFYTLLTD